MCTCFYLVTYGRQTDGAWKVYREFIAPNLRFDYFSVVSLSPSTVPPFGLSCIVSFAESSCLSHLAVCGSAEELVFEKSVSSLRPFPNIFSRSSRRSLALSIATRVRARAVVHVSFRASVRAVTGRAAARCKPALRAMRHCVLISHRSGQLHNPQTSIDDDVLRLARVRRASGPDRYCEFFP